MRCVPLALLVFLAACGSAACGSDGPLPLGSDDEAVTTTRVSALDSLADEDGMVSVNGRVADHAEGERELVLDDGTGLVRVEIPEDLPALVGHRLFVRGEVRRDDGAPVLDAVEWLYDSTAISIHSD